MYPSQHLFYGTIFGIFLLLLFPSFGVIEFLIIILSTLLVDVDHYLWYAYKKKNLNLKNAYFWFVKNEEKILSLPRNQREKFYIGFCFLHGIEILIISFSLVFISRYFLFIFVGVVFHLLLDIVNGTIFMDRIDKFSLMHDFFKFKKLKYIEEI